MIFDSLPAPDGASPDCDAVSPGRFLPGVCTHEACIAIVPAGTVGGRCPKHARRASASRRGYGREWKRIRDQVLADEPKCVACNAAPATQVDHVLPLADGGTNERDNLQPLCVRCHSAKTAKQDGGFGH